MPDPSAVFTASPRWTDALGTSDVFLAFQERLALLADSDRPILIVGERGTGKELAVQRLHYLSARWEKPLVTVLCPAITPSLLESELFGHEAGAFTGARGRRAGYFERADTGSVFLDEVADMPLPLQDKLLRVIEYGSFERVGGVSPMEVDVRVLAATNRDLPALAREGKFREDLLDRLAFEVLQVPPLRARGEDRLLLARHFAGRMLLELERKRGGGELPEGNPEGDRFLFGEKALRQLEDYDWPGNVRELKNVVERSVLRGRGRVIEELDIDPFAPLYGASSSPRRELPHEPDGLLPGECASPSFPSKSAFTPSPLPAGFRLPAAVAAFEREALARALEQARYRQKEAAALLGLTYHQFRALYRKHGPGSR